MDKVNEIFIIENEMMETVCDMHFAKQSKNKTKYFKLLELLEDLNESHKMISGEYVYEPKAMLDFHKTLWDF